MPARSRWTDEPRRIWRPTSPDSAADPTSTTPSTSNIAAAIGIEVDIDDAIAIDIVIEDPIVIETDREWNDADADADVDVDVDVDVEPRSFSKARFPAIRSALPLAPGQGPGGWAGKPPRR